MVSVFQRRNNFEDVLLSIVLSVWANLSRHIGEATMTVFVEELDVFIAAAEEILFVLPSLSGGHNGLTTTLIAQS